MTQDEFIVGYMQKSEIPASFKTEDGFDWGDGFRLYALPCACGDESCDGWAMVHERMLESHKKLYGP